VEAATCKKNAWREKTIILLWYAAIVSGRKEKNLSIQISGLYPREGLDAMEENF
jgi:hypothetical protein